MVACGWCLAFNDECCEGRVPHCTHRERCQMPSREEMERRTAAARDQAMARARLWREEEYMTGRIQRAWSQLDVAVDEIVRLRGQIEAAGKDGDTGLAESFKRDLLVEQAKARGKAEILALLMPAPLDSADAVSAEAGKRYAAKQRGAEHKTPGLRLVARTVMDDVEGRPETT